MSHIELEKVAAELTRAAQKISNALFDLDGISEPGDWDAMHEKEKAAWKLADKAKQDYITAYTEWKRSQPHAVTYGGLTGSRGHEAMLHDSYYTDRQLA